MFRTLQTVSWRTAARRDILSAAKHSPDGDRTQNIERSVQGRRVTGRDRLTEGATALLLRRTDGIARCRGKAGGEHPAGR